MYILTKREEEGVIQASLRGGKCNLLFKLTIFSNELTTILHLIDCRRCRGNWLSIKHFQHNIYQGNIT